MSPGSPSPLPPTPTPHLPPQDPLSSLERELALQLQIAEAARRLSREEHLGRQARRQRKHAVRQEEQKLRELERHLGAWRRHSGPPPAPARPLGRGESMGAVVPISPFGVLGCGHRSCLWPAPPCAPAASSVPNRPCRPRAQAPARSAPSIPRAPPLEMRIWSAGGARGSACRWDALSPGLREATPGLHTRLSESSQGLGDSWAVYADIEAHQHPASQPLESLEAPRSGGALCFPSPVEAPAPWPCGAPGGGLGPGPAINTSRLPASVTFHMWF